MKPSEADKAMREIPYILCLTAVLFASGCSSVTEKQCDKAFDHYFGLKMVGVPEVIQKVESVAFEERRANFLSLCVGNVKPELINCWLSSKDLDALNACEKSQSILR